MTLAQNGAAPTVGLAGTFTLTATEYDATGKLLSGTYPQPIVVTTNDTTDLTLSAIPSTGTSGGSVTIPNSQTVVLVSYDGLAVRSGTQFAASANALTSVTAGFTPVKQAVTVSPISTFVIGQSGATPHFGSPGQFALSISAYDASGNPITGSYATPIVLTTNDGTDLQLSTVQNAPGSASVTVPNAQTTVFVSYDGSVVPNGTVFSAFAGTASSTLAFTPTNPASPPQVISKLSITRNGAGPVLGQLGVFPVFVTAYDENNIAIYGTLPNAVNVTINESCDMSLSLGGSGSVEPCIVNGQPVAVDNIGAQIINNANQVVFLNYDGIRPVPAGTDISATTLANICSVISFPANTAQKCPAPVPNSSRIRRIVR
ncbi:MAG: hypothetical protein IAI50_04790 [Candidatus Eremiobacteraeota bacterium]|nr:hypothetical protein [Candidatus Eremiobacteraeota bacterium]